MNSELEAGQFMRAAQSWLRAQGLVFRRADLPLRLRPIGAGRRWLSRAPGPIGLTTVRSAGIPGLWLSVTVEEIAIRPGLPRHVFEATCVHELGHAWLADRRIRLPKIEEEGFCQLLEARWLAHLTSPEARDQLTGIQQTRDPVYGAGFRRIMTEAAQRGGFPNFVNDLLRRAGYASGLGGIHGTFRNGALNRAPSERKYHEYR